VSTAAGVRLTLAEAGEALDLSVEAVVQMVADGDLRAVRGGRREGLRIPAEALAEVARSAREEPR
jgi:excisionase family DNA binding protein